MLLERMSAGFDLSLNCCDFCGTILEPPVVSLGAILKELNIFCRDHAFRDIQVADSCEISSAKKSNPKFHSCA